MWRVKEYRVKDQLKAAERQKSRWKTNKSVNHRMREEQERREEEDEKSQDAKTNS